MFAKLIILLFTGYFFFSAFKWGKVGWPPIRRAQQPVAFWLFVAVYGFFCLFTVWAILTGRMD